MKSEYGLWVNNYLKENEFTLGKCKEACTAMNTDFPELSMIPGHVYTDWGKRAHWWLEDTEGNIIDPTVSQFNLVYEYEKFEPGQEVKIGRCLYCGEGIYQQIQSLEDQVEEKQFCNDNCYKSYASYLLNPLDY